MVSLCCTSCQKASPSDFEISIQRPVGRLLRGDTLFFAVDVTGDVARSKLSYLWEFGAASFSSESSPKHVYHTHGSARVILTVRSEDGVSHADSVQLNIIPSLKFLSETTIDVFEPSGLTLSHDKQSLWAVSDYSNESIKRLSLDGEVLHSIHASLGGDLEGVVQTPDNHLWVVQEYSGWLMEVDTSGAVLDTIQIASVTEGSGGLEGIAYDPQTSSFYLLKEKDPSVLIVLDSTFERSLYQKIGFAGDYSGLCFVPGASMLLTVSHENAMVYEMDLTGNVLNEFGVDLPQVEGIAFDEATSIFYLVDDSTNKLFRYTYWDD